MGQGFGDPKEDEALSVVEICAGKHRIASAAAEYGLPSSAFDVPWLVWKGLERPRKAKRVGWCLDCGNTCEVEYSRHHDLLTCAGLLIAFQLVWLGCNQLQQKRK